MVGKAPAARNYDFLRRAAPRGGEATQKRYDREKDKIVAHSDKWGDPSYSVEDIKALTGARSINTLNKYFGMTRREAFEQRRLRAQTMADPAVDAAIAHINTVTYERRDTDEVAITVAQAKALVEEIVRIRNENIDLQMQVAVRD